MRHRSNIGVSWLKPRVVGRRKDREKELLLQIKIKKIIKVPGKSDWIPFYKINKSNTLN